MRNASFRAANHAFEKWLRRRCAVVEDDLVFKHKRMKKNAFVFLRATYFRWASTIEALCPELVGAPSVLSIGDTHIENFGTWRDLEGRLIWGANDFDEATVMPYPFDLVRLAASARLAPGRDLPSEDVTRAILRGYTEGVKQPGTFVLDERWQWLLDLVECQGKSHEQFWQEIDELTEIAPPPHVKKALKDALPEAGLKPTFAARRAGGGSLGRPRFVAVAPWRGGRVVREAKALVASAWEWSHGHPTAKPQFMQLAEAPFRGQDPYLRQSGDFIVRRLAADGRKAELGDHAGESLKRQLLMAMGQELGSLHGADPASRRPILSDLAARPIDWLVTAARKASSSIEEDFAEWAGSQAGT